MARYNQHTPVVTRRTRIANNRAILLNNTRYNLGDIFNFDDDLFRDFNVEVSNHNINLQDLCSPIEQLNNDLKNNQKFLRVAHINARSIPGHIVELIRIISETDCDIIGVSETFIKDDTPLSRVNIENYNLYTENRTHTSQGGVAFYIKKISKLKKYRFLKILTTQS